MSSATRLAMRCSAKWGSAWARLPNNTARLRGLVLTSSLSRNSSMIKMARTDFRLRQQPSAPCH